MDEIIKFVGNVVWGPHMLLLLVGSGVYFTIRLRLIQFTGLKEALRLTALGAKKKYLDENAIGDVTPYQALMTALGGAIGNGNIAGVATAIAMGGPGAVFWMWVSAIFGMATSFVESTLGVRYRREGKDGAVLSGPMYYIKDGLGWGWLAGIFAFFMGIKTLLSTTTVQTNSMALVLNKMFGLPMLLSGLVLAFLTWLVIIRGIKQIATVTAKLTPFMVLLYFGAAVYIILTNIESMPGVISRIIEGAFTTSGTAGGAAGISVMMAIRYGVARGVYSNEAGTGSAPVVHGAAKVRRPADQGSISMLGVLVDTLIVNSLTAFVILLSREWDSGLTSTTLTAAGFGAGLGELGGWVVAASSLLFGYSTLIVWPYYGEQCFAYLFGQSIRVPFRWAFCAFMLLGTFSQAEVIWSWGDILNGMMAIPNLVAILFLSGKAFNLAREKR